MLEEVAEDELCGGGGGGSGDDEELEELVGEKAYLSIPLHTFSGVSLSPALPLPDHVTHRYPRLTWRASSPPILLSPAPH